MDTLLNGSGALIEKFQFFLSSMPRWIHPTRAHSRSNVHCYIRSHRGNSCQTTINRRFQCGGGRRQCRQARSTLQMSCMLNDSGTPLKEGPECGSVQLCGIVEPAMLIPIVSQALGLTDNGLVQPKVAPQFHTLNLIRDLGWIQQKLVLSVIHSAKNFGGWHIDGCRIPLQQGRYQCGQRIWRIPVHQEDSVRTDSHIETLHNGVQSIPNASATFPAVNAARPQ